MESSHTSGGSTSTGREDIANSDVVDEFGVEGDLLVGGTEDVGEDELGFGVLEATLLSLANRNFSVYTSRSRKKRTLVMAVRRAETMTTSSALLWRSLAFPEGDMVDKTG